MSDFHGELYKFFYIAAISVGLFIAILLVNKKDNSNGATTLAMFIFTLLVLPIHGYFGLLGHTIPLAISAAAHSFIFIYGPFLYLFLSILLNQTQTTQQKALHFLPFILVFLVKLNAIPYNLVLLTLAMSLLIVGYLLVNLRLVVMRKGQLSTLLKQYSQSSYFWLLFIVVGLSWLIVFDLTLIITYLLGYEINAYYWHSMVVAICLYILVISSFFIYCPMLFSKREIQPLENPQNVNEEPTTVCSILTPVATESNLSDDVVEELKSHLNEIITEQKPHLQNALSLGELAELLDISNAHLSELLNKHMGGNFYWFINNLRFKASLALLNEPTCHLSMLDIAYHSGFNNKNTFYRIFKEKTNQTPRQYRLNVVRKLTA